MKVKGDDPFELTTSGGFLILMLCLACILTCCCTVRSVRLMLVTCSGLCVNPEPCRVGTSILLSAAHPERVDATDELGARLELTQTGMEPLSVGRNKADGQ